MKSVQLINRTTKLVTVDKNSEASVTESVLLPPKGKIVLGLTDSEINYIKVAYPMISISENR